MNRISAWQKVIWWVTFYSIAMGLLESVVVIYLRVLYYPSGFSFPLAPMDPRIVITEVSRETATVIMLISIGAIAGKNFSQRFGFFIFSFAIWDIFYYVFLKLFIGWPESIFTWDILFLIPVIWTSPVICPVIVSVTMVILALIVIKVSENETKFKPGWKIWSLFIIGSLLMIFSFMLDFIQFLHRYLSFKEFVDFYKRRLIIRVAEGYFPGSFNWLVFLAAEMIILSGIILLVLKLSKTKK